MSGARNQSFRQARCWLLGGAAALALALLWLGRARLLPGRPGPRVSPAQLEEVTKGQPLLTYLGVEGDCHRFETQDGRVFLVARDELEVPSAWPVEAGAGLFVRIEDGRLRAPDPEQVARWVRRHGLDRPAPDESGEAGGGSQHLPVVRYDKSSEPQLLILTSDGDWSDEDLARLDGALDRWLRDHHPADGPHPRLWYDQDESAADRKTIIVRARHFRAEWCEPLARHLGKEYPFLWQLEVGRRPEPAPAGDR